MSNDASNDVKLNEKEELFAQEVAKGSTYSDAYRAAYNADGMQKESIHVEASRVKSNPKVSLRIKQLQSEAAENTIVTLGMLLVELEEARLAALSAENPQSSAAVGATMGKAKLLGLDKQVIDHTSSDGSMVSKPAINLKGLSDEQLRALNAIAEQSQADSSGVSES